MTRPQLASTRAELAELLAPHRRAGRRIGLVPTMGALHDGHAALMQVAREAVSQHPSTEPVSVDERELSSVVEREPASVVEGELSSVVERERSEQSKPGDPASVVERERSEQSKPSDPASVVERERSEQSKPGELSTASTAEETSSNTERGPVVVSIFVNPMQFGAGEDLDRYPRTLEADLDLCAREGVDIVFAPSVDEVYPGGDPQVTVEPGPLGSVLEGRTRPGHYRGVLTVVAKLFGLVRPDVAVFGQKDYQQLVLIRRMVDDLCLGIDVVGAPTVREADGLALSSRNRYLDAEQRELATVLSRSLRAGVLKAADGADAVAEAALAELSADEAEVDYLVVTAPDLSAAPARGEGRVLVAATIGTTRLIDNVPVFLGNSHEQPTAEGEN